MGEDLRLGGAGAKTTSSISRYRSITSLIMALRSREPKFESAMYMMAVNQQEVHDLARTWGATLFYSVVVLNGAVEHLTDRPAVL